MAAPASPPPAPAPIVEVQRRDEAIEEFGETPFEVQAAVAVAEKNVNLNIRKNVFD